MYSKMFQEFSIISIEIFKFFIKFTKNDFSVSNQSQSASQPVCECERVCVCMCERERESVIYAQKVVHAC